MILYWGLSGLFLVNIRKKGLSYYSDNPLRVVGMVFMFA
jgi:hypothetical protein